MDTQAAIQEQRYLDGPCAPATDGPDESTRATLSGSPAGVKPSVRRRAERRAARSHRNRITSSLLAGTYHVARLLGQSARYLPLRIEQLNAHVVRRDGPYILAVTHLSYLEPAILSLIVARKVDWVARLEFYKYCVARAALAALDCIPVNRFGVPVSTIRTSIERLRRGRVVGIFPEGNTTAGADFACRGGPIKRGVCLLSQRAGVPIIPCVVLGTHVLNGPGPWIPFKTLPFRRTPVWVAFGEAIEPPRGIADARAAREHQAAALRAAYCALYRELRDRFGLCDGQVP